MKKALLALLFLMACREETVAPNPVEMTAETVGYFCQMNVLEHPGPKAQIHLASYPGAPLFFSQVKDAVTYLRLPEQIDTVTAAYVNDMGHAPSWSEPGTGNWIAAKSAFYVIGSRMLGGMDAPEYVPFADRVQAAAFAAANGGQVYDWNAIPADDPSATAQDASETDISTRLQALAAPKGN